MIQYVYKLHEKERARGIDDIRGLFDKSVFNKQLNSHPDYSLIYAIIYVGPDTYSLSKKNKTHEQTKLIYIGQTHQYLIERFVNHVTTASTWSKDNMKNYHLYRAMHKLGIHNFIILPLEKIMASRTTNKEDMSKLTTDKENEWMFKTNSVFPKGLNAHYEAKRHTSRRRGTAKRSSHSKPITYPTWQLSIAKHCKPKRLFISHDIAKAAQALHIYLPGKRLYVKAYEHLQKKISRIKLMKILKYIHDTSNTYSRPNVNNDLHRIFFMIHRFLYDTIEIEDENRKKKKVSERFVIRLPYISKKLDRLKLPSRIIKELRQLIPIDILEQGDIQMPMVQFTYGTPQVLQLIDTKYMAKHSGHYRENKCTICARPENKKFLGEGFDHIVTLDYGVLQNTRWTNLLNQGTSYRAEGATDFIEVADKNGDWTDHIMKAIKPWIKYIGSNFGINEAELVERVLVLAQKINHDIKIVKLEICKEGLVETPCFENIEGFELFDPKKKDKPLTLTTVDKVNGILCICNINI